jgi:uncharacterized protein (TIGR03032 family)
MAEVEDKAAAVETAPDENSGENKTELRQETDDSVGVSAAEQKKAAEQKVNYSFSGGLVQFLHANRISLAVSSYQSGRFYLIGHNQKGQISINERFFRKAMGISVNDNSILLATLFQILRFENVLEKGQFINHNFDSCFVPRITYTTGTLDAHDVGLTYDGRIIFVNTRFNCLALASTRHSFTPVWKPHFISAIVDEDRCHLNGMALDKGRPRYVTAVSRSDTIDGWRDRRADGGIVMDVITNEVICEGLSMPHSPRIHNDKLWVLNSGTGELGWIERGPSAQKSKFHPVVFCPGFVRGLSFHGKFAFVGLSKPRYHRFEGLALDQKLQQADSEPWCGVQVIDLEKQSCVQWLRVDGAISELYDVGVVPGVLNPMSLGFAAPDIAKLITHDKLTEL